MEKVVILVKPQPTTTQSTCSAAASITISVSRCSFSARIRSADCVYLLDVLKLSVQRRVTRAERRCPLSNSRRIHPTYNIVGQEQTQWMPRIHRWRREDFSIKLDFLCALQTTGGWSWLSAECFSPPTHSYFSRISNSQTHPAVCEMESASRARTERLFLCMMWEQASLESCSLQPRCTRSMAQSVCE